MVYSDMTQFAYCRNRSMGDGPPRPLQPPLRFGTLGYCHACAAIGGAIGRPGCPHWRFIGDYGFQLHGARNLAASVETGPAIAHLLDNGKWARSEDSMTRAADSQPNARSSAHNPDFCKLAEAYGAKCSRAPKFHLAYLTRGYWPKPFSGQIVPNVDLS